METCASSLVAQPSNRGVEERRTPQPVSSANSRVELVRVANNMLYVSKSNRLRACFIDVSEDSLYESQSSLSKAGATEIACVLLSEHAFRCARVGHALNLWTSSRALRPRFLMHEFAPALLEFVRSRERVQPAWTARRVIGSGSNWRWLEGRRPCDLLTSGCIRANAVYGVAAHGL